MGEHGAASASKGAGRRAKRRRLTEERGPGLELGLLNRLAVAIADAPDLDAALHVVLSEVGQSTGWDCGQAWVPTDDGAGLACRPVWYGALLGSALARRRAEEALRGSEERFRSVVESAIDAVVLADQVGTIVGWNRAAEEMFGYAQSEVLGRPLTIIMPERFREAHQAGL